MRVEQKPWRGIPGKDLQEEEHEERKSGGVGIVEVMAGADYKRAYIPVREVLLNSLGNRRATGEFQCRGLVYLKQ